MDLCHPDSAELSSGETEELQRIKWHRKQLLEDIQKLKDEIADVFAQIDCFESAEESRMAQKEKELCIGRKKFNMEPVKGIQYLIEHKLLTAETQDIAQFLYKGEGLNKTAIGTYLGERDPVNLQVLQAFVDCHEFANLNLVQALRQFLWSFRLPGEAQKIDRMMESFAARYCLCNPGVFQSTDTCYVLSFSIIMLNTSLHNPNVRDRPPFERFVSMNRGINDGCDLPEEQLRHLFDSIKSEPFSIPEDDGNDLTHTFFNPDREGWLLKLGGRVKTWKRRWFILTDSCLYYFEFTTDKEPRGIIPLENLSVQKVDDPKKPVRVGWEARTPSPALLGLQTLRAVLPGALQPRLPRPEDKGLQDRRRRQGGGGQARVLPDLGRQRRGAGPVDRGPPSQHHPRPLLRPGLCPEEEDRQQAVSFPRGRLGHPGACGARRPTSHPRRTLSSHRYPPGALELTVGGRQSSGGWWEPRGVRGGLPG
ncbi:cytohesin-4 isoform X2 [Dasypus novemcinctus]|uniref:cytohesin-4 isoform X2 n=1 Tax=Dasypus novemcinctus TaxID=9361 RepID=UPI00265F7C4E|nr:cytohesin-4 isoform X2 [Dasypus novemcinctus]